MIYAHAEVGRNIKIVVEEISNIKGYNNLGRYWKGKKNSKKFAICSQKE